MSIDAEARLTSIHEAIARFELLEWRDLIGNVKVTKVKPGDIIEIYRYQGGSVGYIKVNGIEVGSIAIISNPEVILRNSIIKEEIIW